MLGEFHRHCHAKHQTGNTEKTGQFRPSRVLINEPTYTKGSVYYFQISRN
jgi:hypothetical protein